MGPHIFHWLLFLFTWCYIWVSSLQIHSEIFIPTVVISVGPLGSDAVIKAPLLLMNECPYERSFRENSFLAFSLFTLRTQQEETTLEAESGPTQTSAWAFSLDSEPLRWWEMCLLLIHFIRVAQMDTYMLVSGFREAGREGRKAGRCEESMEGKKHKIHPKVHQESRIEKWTPAIHGRCCQVPLKMV